ncbi:uncharacterized protein LOC112245424 isoform X1 [Oncorhynchus tshawytscha]|uniref:uncharacterized protein LOC112245424 isoform X1 n=1 Tax=Oncorhynchus tshawytscha TaxID=74940 RepID=UPI000D098941|nr:uncharacterized protein LOC112245424 isoform X1 [Oncorhynchus tshawytscha]
MQHLLYQPLLLNGNKYLQQKWDKASYEMHLRKVKSAKPTIDTTAPKTYSHLALKMKKQKFQEQSMSKIQRENNMLLEKISHIMRTTGRIDNRNDYEDKSASLTTALRTGMRTGSRQSSSWRALHDIHEELVTKRDKARPVMKSSNTETEEKDSLRAEQSSHSSITHNGKRGV